MRSVKIRKNIEGEETQMKRNYSFLNDELALIEIRKHKWIESQKNDCEIGFATAAWDWIRKYGNDWLRYRLNPDDTHGIFSEKRKYRRFAYQCPLILKTNDNLIAGQANDINLVGLSCTVPVSILDKANVEVTLDIKKGDGKSQKSTFRFNSRIIRIAELDQSKPSPLYRVVLSCSETLRDFLRFNSGLFAGA